VSLEGIKGTWNPSVISTVSSGYYLFTPDAGQCCDTASIFVLVTKIGKPTFNPIANICSGSTAPSLPATSKEGFAGTWLPATISNTTSGLYVFTPINIICADTVSIYVTVNNRIQPTFAPMAPFCSGTPAPALTATSLEGITGSWSPTTIDNTQSGVYVFLISAGECALYPTPLNVQVLDKPSLPLISGPNSVAVGELISLSANATNGVWSSTNTSIATINPNGEITGVSAGIDTIKYEVKNICGNNSNFTIVEVTSLNVYIPNTFSPNGDGKNDLLYIRGNGSLYPSVEIRIFNQWGNQIFEGKGAVNNPAIAWNGTQNGKVQPTGVYIYVAKITNNKGETFIKKGSISLIK